VVKMLTKRNWYVSVTHCCVMMWTELNLKLAFWAEMVLLTSVFHGCLPREIDLWLTVGSLIHQAKIGSDLGRDDSKLLTLSDEILWLLT
jgi:hypothetical protein